MSVKCELKQINKVYYISGQLDKAFHSLAETISATEEIKFNLKNLISINSGGIREWVLLMIKLGLSRIYLYECPKVFIDQVNMVKNFVPPNAKIMSFYVPYYNEKNGTEKSVLFTFNKDYTEDKILPLKKVLDEKGDVMEIDIVESKYFKFIQSSENKLA